MKTLIKLLGIYSFALFIVLNLVACRERSDIALQESFHVTATTLPTSYLGGEGLITLSEEGFTATSDQEWCKITVEGKSIKVVIDRYEGYASRSSNINVTKSGKRINIPVTQLGTVNFITNMDHLSYTYEGGTLSFAIQAQATPDIRILNGGDAWLSYNIADGQITFTAIQNEGPARDAPVEIIIGAYRMRVIAKQSRNPNESGIVEMVNYEDIPGKYILEGTFIDDTFTQEVEIIAAVPDQLYIIKGLIADIPLMFDEDKRGVRIPMMEQIDGLPGVQLLFTPNAEHIDVPLSYNKDIYLKAPTMYANGGRLSLTFTCNAVYTGSTGETFPYTGFAFWYPEASEFYMPEDNPEAKPIITSFTLTKKLD